MYSSSLQSFEFNCSLLTKCIRINLCEIGSSILMNKIKGLNKHASCCM
uniref:Uncharacterized protein n=1 Tax=Arundo donax TaxID=35708 RepID=A0A0A8ZY24_ARUDO